MAGLIERSKLLAKRALKADIIKVFSLTSISTIVKMCTGLISVKVVASIIGPAGVALVGQLNNFATMALSLATGGINSGITKYVAEYREDNNTIAKFLSTGLRITIISSIICAAILILFNNRISNLIMLSPNYGYVFVIFGVTIILYALNNMLISIVNGYKEFRKFVYINISNSIVGLIVSVVLVIFWQLKGALIAAVTYQSVVLFVSLWMLYNTKWFKWEIFKENYSYVISKKYFRYTLMTFTTALCMPIAQMFLRGYIMSEISPVEAGWWEGMNRISNMYLTVFISSFTVYYLPRLSEISDKTELRHEIFKAYRVIVPILLCVFTIIYLLRFIIIKILFTPEFIPMSQLFIWQIIGDLFKICSWILAFLMIAKAMMSHYIATEIIFTFSYLGIGFIFIHLNSVVGLCQAYIINYILYCIVMAFIFRRIIF